MIANSHETMTTVEEINDVVALRTDNRLLQMMPRDLVAAADAIKTEVVEHLAAMNSANSEACWFKASATCLQPTWEHGLFAQ